MPLLRRRLHSAAIAILLLAAVAVPAYAQGTATVALDDLAYADVDRLVGLGLLDGVIVGQRPYSAREMTRLVHAARAEVARRLESGTGDARLTLARGPLRRLDARFATAESLPAADPRLRMANRGSISARSTDAVRRSFSGNITERLETTIDPLAVRRLGSPPLRGGSLALDLAHDVAPAPWLAVHLAERLEGAPPYEGLPQRWNAELLRASVRALFGNVAVRVGREQTAWAQWAGDGLMLASDAPALDLVSVSGDAPFLLPGPLRRLGPTQATLVLAELGASQVRNRSKLLTYKVSVQPQRSIELGASFLNHFGGEGARTTSFGNRLIDFLPFVDIFRGHNYTDTTRTLDVDSDKQLGVDGRVRIPRLGGLLMMFELVIDDFDVHRIPTLFTWDGAQSIRFVLPSAGGSPLGAAVSAKHTGVRTYTHGALSNGLTTRGRLLGDELGPDAKAFGAEVSWNPGGPMAVTLEGRSAIYSRASYVTEEQGTHFLIRRVGPASNELRERVVAAVVMHRRHRLALTSRVAVERIRNAAFTGASRHDHAADLSVRFGF